MRITSLIQIAVFALAVLPATVSAQIITQADPCVTTPPDQVFDAPLSWGGSLFVSGSGFYGYRPCPFFLMDIRMATYSGCDQTLNGLECPPLSGNGGQFDLPSSGAANGTQVFPRIRRLWPLRNMDACVQEVEYGVRLYVAIFSTRQGQLAVRFR